MIAGLRPGPVVACIDGSSHTAGVCDHAAWLAKRIDRGVTLLTVTEPPEHAFDGVLPAAAERVSSAGPVLTSLLTHSGGFADAASRAASIASMLVVGRRGRTTPPHSLRLGENVRRLLGSAQAPLCLAPPRRRPIARILALYNRATPDEATSRFLATHPSLDGLSCELAGFGAPRLASGASPHPDEVICDFLRLDTFDLLVLPRSALLTDPRRRDLEGLLTELDAPVLLPGHGRLNVVRL